MKILQYFCINPEEYVSLSYVIGKIINLETKVLSTQFHGSLLKMAGALVASDQSDRIDRSAHVDS